MRLINTTSLVIEEFVGTDLENKVYVILSHRWQNDELTYQEFSAPTSAVRVKAGYIKILRAAKQAELNGFDWLWVDTCCIDKTSSSELTEAINSMYKWYKKSAVCFAYLCDVGCIDDMFRSEWFKRGWTLQELIAPHRLVFLDEEWNVLADKKELADMLSAITTIPTKVFYGEPVWQYCVAERMRWACGRHTKREEDLAYCLIGIFDVAMPLVYGEGGNKAFRRLQEIIIQSSSDETIFAWSARPSEDLLHPARILAISPDEFSEHKLHRSFHYGLDNRGGDFVRPYRMTNRGLEITLPIRGVEHDSGNYYLAELNCFDGQQRKPYMTLRRLGENWYYRTDEPLEFHEVQPSWSMGKIVRYPRQYLKTVGNLDMSLRFKKTLIYIEQPS